MTDDKREQLMQQFLAIEDALQAIAEGRIVLGDPATVKCELLLEQDEIEGMLGQGSIDRRMPSEPL